MVRLCSSNGTIELIVSDNGMGMPDNMDLRTVTSLGLHLVIILVENQLDGEIRLDRSERTTFCITFESWLFLNVLKVHSNPVMKSHEHSLDCSANLRFKTSESEMDFCHELEVRGG